MDKSTFEQRLTPLERGAINSMRELARQARKSGMNRLANASIGMAVAVAHGASTRMSRHK